MGFDDARKRKKKNVEYNRSEQAKNADKCKNIMFFQTKLHAAIAKVLELRSLFGLINPDVIGKPTYLDPADDRFKIYYSRMFHKLKLEFSDLHELLAHLESAVKAKALALASAFPPEEDQLGASDSVLFALYFLSPAR